MLTHAREDMHEMAASGFNTALHAYSHTFPEEYATQAYIRCCRVDALKMARTGK